MLTVYKASAGSGKTFRLVVEYLKLLLQDDHNYRTILAVTFTNKATAEMKERIVEQLSLLAKGKATGYRKILVEETGLSEIHIAQKAEKILENILFDYNRFSISTIDSFTQRIIKSFNREIGVTPSYQLELDIEIVINEAVDRLISSIDSNKELRIWLEEFIDEKIRGDKNFAIERDLKELGKELFRERLQEKVSHLEKFFSNPQNRKDYLNMLNRVIHSYENHIKKLAGDIRTTYKNHGYTVDDFSNKNSGVAGFIEKTADGIIPDKIGVRTREAVDSEDKWATRNNPIRTKLIPLIISDLKLKLTHLVNYIDRNFRHYFTAVTIKKEWYTLAILLDLDQEIAALNREKNSLPLANSNLLLNLIISGNDTPFIYEKTGNIYHHFMLDEFQDTSAMQWTNFKPLISNALSLGKSNLAVGDVKQSIYRWRNSDWNILAQSVFSDFPGFTVSPVRLHNNYRSDERIVSFNNLFFKSFVDKMKDHNKISPENKQFEPEFKAIYDDLAQNVINKGSTGHVKIELIDDTDINFKEQSLQKLVDQIKFLQENGISAGDIAILIRRNVEGEAIVTHLLEIADLPENQKYNLKVLSNESLFMRSSPAVIFVVSLVRHLLNKEEKLTKATLLQLHETLFGATAISSAQTEIFSGINQNHWYYNPAFESEFDEKFGELIKEVEQEILTSSIDEIILKISARFGLLQLPPAVPFLQTLIDKVAELRKTMSNDLSNFLIWWEEKGQNESVQANEDIDAVRLITIHKAKGLEFKVVLIPFFDWKLDARNPLIWCHPPEPPFNQAPLVPLSLTGMLENTIFAADYYRENFNILVDNINLAYVAFTRARSVLMVNAPQKSASNQISHYFPEAIKEMAALKSFDPAWDSDNVIFESGNLQSTKAPVQQLQTPSKIAWHYTDFSSRLRLRSTGEDFVEVVESGATRKNLGKLVHAIFSEIKTSGDVQPTLKKAELSGLIKPDELKQLNDEIERMVNHPDATNWFDETYNILTEKQILSPNNNYRPDRIMLANGKAIVVDFKTGLSRRKIYHKQVEDYCLSLIDSGIPDVTGFLWYMHENHLEQVFGSK